MNLKNQLAVAFIISLLALLGFCVMAVFVSMHTILALDGTIISFVQGWEAPMLTTIMKGFTFIGGTTSVAVIFFLSLIILYKVFNHRSELILFTVVMAGANVLFITLKLLFT